MIKTSTIIFLNDKKEVLLFLRDNKPNIPDPNKWDLFGGFGEKGETPEETIIREIKEEIEMVLKNFKLFKVFNWRNKQQIVFYKTLNINPEDINLHEGQAIKYFNKNELLKMDLANTSTQVLEEFFKKFGFE